MKKIKNLLIRSYSSREKIIFLLILSLIMRDAFINIPYVNILIVNIENRIAIVWFIALLIFRPSLHKLLIFSIFFLFLFFLIFMAGGWNSDFGIGVIVYTSLVLVATKYPKK